MHICSCIKLVLCSKLPVWSTCVTSQAALHPLSYLKSRNLGGQTGASRTGWVLDLKLQSSSFRALTSPHICDWMELTPCVLVKTTLCLFMQHKKSRITSSNSVDLVGTGAVPLTFGRSWNSAGSTCWMALKYEKAVSTYLSKDLLTLQVFPWCSNKYSWSHIWGLPSTIMHSPTVPSRATIGN